MKLTACVLVGCGGTGGMLAEPLARLLAYHPNGLGPTPRVSQLALVDGDTFEARNAQRQLGTEPGVLKAVALAARVPVPHVVIPKYVDRQSFREDVLGGIPDHATRGLGVILAVDNHATRKEILLALQDAGVQNLLCLSPGNDLRHGQVICWARSGGVDLIPNPLSSYKDGTPRYPELDRPTDRLPGGCIAAAPSTPQLLLANALAATICLAYVTAWLDDAVIYPRTDFGHPDRLAWRVRPDDPSAGYDLAKLSPGPIIQHPERTLVPA